MISRLITAPNIAEQDSTNAKSWPEAFGKTFATKKNIALVILTILTIFPLFHLVVTSSSLIAIGPEFVYYRVGNAYSLIIDESFSVLPVQGLPNALVSKWIVQCQLFFGMDIAAPATLQAYCKIFYSLVIAALLVAFLITVTSANYQTSMAWSVGLFFLPLWYLGGASFGLLASPEYWLCEWLYLGVTLLAFLWLGDRHTLGLSLVLGIWAGIGIATKISMLPVAVLLFGYTLRQFGWKSILHGILFSVGIAASYLGIIYCYAGWDQGIAILQFQYQFFLSPNDSATYGNINDVLANNPLSLVYGIAAVISGLAYFALKRTFVSFCESFLGLGACLLFGYLLYKRPHDSSLASALIGMLFWNAYFLLRMPEIPQFRFSVTYASVFLLCWPFLNTGVLNEWFHKHPIESRQYFHYMRESAKFCNFDDAEKTMMFMPDNQNNSFCPLHGLAYNGGIGIYPMEMSNKGQLSYKVGGRAINSLFGNVVVVGGTDAEINGLRMELVQKSNIFWAEPIEKRYVVNEPVQKLRAICQHMSIKLKETLLPKDHPQWRFVRTIYRDEKDQ